MKERNVPPSSIIDGAQESLELWAEYQACADTRERAAILAQLRAVEAAGRRAREQTESLAALPAVWADIYGEGAGYLGLLSGLRRAGKLAAVRSAYYDWPRDAAAAVAWVQREAAAERELYHCAHLLTERRRRKAHAAPLTALWVDLDGARQPAVELPPPSLVVASSPGRTQEYWRLTRPIPPAQGEALNRRLALVVGADPSGWDLTQLLRVPGSANHKYPGAPLVKALAARAGAYDPEVFGAAQAHLPLARPRAAAPQAARRTLERPAPARHEPPALALDAPLTRQAERILQGELAKQRPDGGVDRSASLVQIGRVLYGAGLRGEDLVRALAERDTALGWRKYSDRQDARAQYERIVAVLSYPKQGG